MNQTRSITTIILIFALFVSSIVIVDTSHIVDANGAPQRAAGETLRINTTVTIDKTTPQSERTYENVIIEDEGKLIINGGILITKTLICKPVSKNTSFIMKNDGEIRSTLTIQGGFMDVRADEVSLTQSTISVSNETGTLQNGEAGHDCSLTLMSDSSSLVLNDTNLNLQAQAGGQGDSGNSGGRGGSSSVTLATQGSNEIDISGTTMEVYAGKGGDSFAAGWVAGPGGDTSINIRGHVVTIRDTLIQGKSGDSGVAGSNSFGSSTGNCRIEMESYDSDINLKRTDLISNTGVSSGDGEVNSFVKLEATLGSIMWDEGKEGDERYLSLSTLDSDITQLEARDGSELYQVDVGDSPPTGFAGTSVEIYWWAKVRVLDNTGSPMENVAIRYFEPPFTDTMYPPEGPELTDEQGNAWLEVVSFRDENYVRYTFTAEDIGGATGSSDQVRFTENRNELIFINLTTITIVTPFSDGDLIGGQVRFEGSAESGGTSNVVNRVIIYIEDDVIGEAEDISPDGAPPFSAWLLVWDSTTVPDGEYEFSFIAFDNNYQATLTLTLVVDQESVPHPPLLEMVEVIDPMGMTEVPEGGSTEVHVSQKDQFIDFEVIIFDIDYRSETLDEGKDIVSAEYRLIFNSTGEEILSSVAQDFDKKNESGGFTFDFQIDASKKPGTSSALDNGLYRIEFDITDDAGYIKEGQHIKFELFFDYYPNAYAFIDRIDGRRKDKVPQEDQFEDYEAFRDLSTDNSHTIKLRFNLTRSTDQDSDKFGAGQSYQDLTFTVRMRRKTDTGAEDVIVSNEKGLPYVEIEFNVEDVEEDDISTGDFDVWIDVTDEDGLEDTVRYIVRIKHDPPEEENSILKELTGMDFFNMIEDSTMSIIYPVLFILFIIGSLGSMFFFMMKFNKDKKKKLELIEKKRQQERERKKDTSIDEEVSGKYMSTSQKYMEKTGAGKGKEEFSKELEGSTETGDEADVTAGKIQEPPETTPEQQPPQQQPPKQSAPVPQQKPPAQQPPQQQPPQKPPVQQQPPQQQAAGTQQQPQVPKPPAAPPVPKPPQP